MYWVPTMRHIWVRHSNYGAEEAKKKKKSENLKYIISLVNTVKDKSVWYVCE